MISNFQGNQIADSHGKRSTNVHEKERISKTKHIPKQKPMVYATQKQGVKNQMVKPQVPKHQNNFQNLLENNGL